MRTPLVAGNWKMNGTIDSAAELDTQGIVAGADISDAAEVLVCPPFVFLSQVAGAARDRPR